MLPERVAENYEMWRSHRALGASRGRIFRQLLTESLILSATGAVFGFLLAALLIAWLAHQTSIGLPLLALLRIDSSVLLWTVFVAAAAAICFGLLPGIRMASVNLQDALKDSGSGSGHSRRHEQFARSS